MNSSLGQFEVKSVLHIVGPAAAIERIVTQDVENAACDRVELVLRKHAALLRPQYSDFLLDDGLQLIIHNYSF
ncbi:hypothetical protein XSP_001749 [Xanthomonas euroxanthea]|uniref:Uncharacterized protein n=1 Tax=Xanthomonas euroxanthea TaxID=2259622 RepID=A0A8E4DXM4_9XANT|nr:hypothetical protein [Xanthomonas euroxanthea]CAD1790794.1 hypothetical protein XSP_001749 [Xanthomonas euroxanthea]SYZ56778.1 hypothetical protein CPBF367_34480 [Xanthomonas arboricola pv. juglandis]